MTTRVIHIMHAPKNWQEDPQYVYIGRAGKGCDGYFGNPIEKGKICPMCNKIHKMPGDTIPCFNRYFVKKIEQDPEFKRRVMELKNKYLICFCKFTYECPCHGDVYADYLNSIES